MAYVTLDRRADWDNGYWNNSGLARWAFFAIFVVLIIIVLLGTIRVNKKRARQGLQPMHGTRWMMPPSYRQSQTQYQQPDHTRDPELPSAYVPTYTATANDMDLGYYDANGQFHPNPNAKTAVPKPPQAYHSTTEQVNDERGPISDNLPHDLQESDNDSLGDMFRRPSGPPPRSTTASSLSNNNTGNATADDFSRPSGPPPATTTTTDYTAPPSEPIPSSSSSNADFPGNFPESKKSFPDEKKR
ncbi:Protein RCR1 [Candida viswanathii]|uniref:Protein RCR1 n=1 Tax=Candida viswanathii TaxID=5486 RepID=A0A367XMI1_9ASCO|nr:Protein RCR1 [Candida viswanathii]